VLGGLPSATRERKGRDGTKERNWGQGTILSAAREGLDRGGGQTFVGSSTRDTKNTVTVKESFYLSATKMGPARTRNSKKKGESKGGC